MCIAFKFQILLVLAFPENQTHDVGVANYALLFELNPQLPYN